MTRSTWHLSDELDEPGAAERPRPTLVSLHFIRTALRRRMLVCILCAVLGLAGAGSFMLVFSLPHQASASLMLTHDPELDATSAMETNLSLLDSRTVAARATQELGLTMAPEDFRRSVRVEQLSSELLSLTLTADTDAEAVRRLDVLTRVYLDFRAEQLTLQSQVLIDGLRERITQLRVQVADLTRQINRLTRQLNRLSDGDSTDGASRLGDAIAERANLQQRIDTLQQAVEDATLRNSAVVESSRVLDPPAADRELAKRNVVLGLASGLVGGAALGCGTVLFLAITSNRLRQRSDVADALGVPVHLSVGRVSAVPRAVRWLPVLRRIDRRRAEERERLARAFSDELPHSEQDRLAVVGLDNTDELSFALAAAAARVAAHGRSMTVIDLTRRGSRGLQRMRSNLGGASGPVVLRPRGLAPLARDTNDLLAVGQWENGDSTPRPEIGDVTLVLADFDPAVGIDHLAAWADRVVVVVTAGRSSVEKVRTLGDLIRAAGLDLRFAALLHTERTDESSGLGVLPSEVGDETSAPSPAPAVKVRAEEDRAEEALAAGLRAAEVRAEARAKARVRTEVRADADRNGQHPAPEQPEPTGKTEAR
jgi:capsular polysaccharide biosynthesis protein